MFRNYIISMVMAFFIIGCADTVDKMGKGSELPNNTESMETKQQIQTLEIRVLYRERMMLPPGSEVIVTLEDVSKMDVAADIIAKESVRINGAPPYNISINYDAGRLHEKGRYALRGRIENNGQLLFINTHRINVLEEITGKPVEILVKRVPLKSGKQATHNTNLANTYWKLTALSEIPVQLGAGNKELFMVLTSDGSNLRGFSGCNNFSGQYELQQTKLRFNKIVSTRKMCFERMKQEQHFLDALINTVGYKIDGENLTLYEKDEHPVARFESRYMQ
ncbi:MAG: META domain-containing protein [Thermodesulfobacteriota bacterium]